MPIGPILYIIRKYLDILYSYKVGLHQGELIYNIFIFCLMILE